MSNTWFTIKFVNLYIDSSFANIALLQLKTTHNGINNYTINEVYIYNAAANTTSGNVLDPSSVNYYFSGNNQSLVSTNNVYTGFKGPISKTLLFTNADTTNSSGIKITTPLYLNSGNIAKPIYILFSSNNHPLRGKNNANDTGTNNFFDLAGTSLSGQSCFAEGTKILSIDSESGEEVYRPVEDLKVGDLVKTYKHGNLPVKLVGKGNMIHTPENIWKQSMYVLKKTDLTEDLIVTGWHSVLVDELSEDVLKKYEEEKIDLENMMIDDKHLLIAGLSDLFTKVETSETFHYYHFVLENDGDKNKKFGVWANGVLTETTSEQDFNYHNWL